MRLSFTFLLALISAGFISAQPSPDLQLLRFPALNSDGSQVAFSYQGDIWTVSANGGPARRLTIHESYDSHPQWSLDDEQLLFQSNRYGNDDIFVLPADGGPTRRLTYQSAATAAPLSEKWMPSG